MRHKVLPHPVVVRPKKTLEFLSQQEIERMSTAMRGEFNVLFHRCALAVLNIDSEISDMAELLESYPGFKIELQPHTSGIELVITNAPKDAFVDGETIIEGIREHLFAVLRDLYNAITLPSPNEDSSSSLTDYVFQFLRRAGAFQIDERQELVVCWGGHSIDGDEYDYTKKVGYQLGLRGLAICTGCGAGAMKGPMKGATIAHAKQRRYHRKYTGISEPGIIASEAPNAIVNELIVMPDIEKRLEAFVRLGHGIVTFPGGVGTAEEILYLLSVYLDPRNEELYLPWLWTAPASSGARYFRQLETFLTAALGKEVTSHYQIIIDNPAEVARKISKGVYQGTEFRRHIKDDSFHFNWSLKIHHELQVPFKATHENMAGLRLYRDLPKHELAMDIRRALSGIVSGNVKAEGIQAVREHGPFKIHGEPEILEPLDELLKSFARDGRMKIGVADYVPCYELVRERV